MKMIVSTEPGVTVIEEKVNFNEVMAEKASFNVG